MKKNVILGFCIIAVLLLCFADGYIRRRDTLQAVSDEAASVQIREQAKRENQARDPDIRVLIKTAGYDSEYHREITLETASGFTAHRADGEEEYPPGEVSYTPLSEEFSGGDILRLSSADGKFLIKNLRRDRQSEAYEGTLEIRRTDGGLLLINELPLETYLAGVVPSEMPSSYPAEALKAQAVCARTYAEKRMQERSASDFFADVDDSVLYQVYNNQDRADAVDAAVRDTAQTVMTDESGELIDAVYYSTSCGLDTRMDLSGEAVFAAFLSAGSLEAYEAEEPWFRWQTDLSPDQLGDICGLSVSERGKNGVINQLVVQKNDGSERVLEGEYQIRAFLGSLRPVVTLQDGETVDDMELLPSAFFILRPWQGDDGRTGYHILGGGYGHGNGMSQNGAKHMAQEGLGYREILQKYYGAVQFTSYAENETRTP